MAFSFGLFVLIILIFILLVILIFWFAWSLRREFFPPKSTVTGTLQPPDVWTKITPGPDPNKNVCTLYTFPPLTISIGTEIFPSLGTPTFNSEILDNLQGQPNAVPVCLDADQVMAKQVQHMCTGTSASTAEGSLILCPLQTGGYTGVGGVEVFYSNMNCLSFQRCVGQLALLSINYQIPDQPDIYCVQRNDENLLVNMGQCDPSNPLQTFRITRTPIGTNPASLTFGNGQNGLLGQILDRTSGLCLTDSGIVDSSFYDSDYQPSAYDCNDQIIPVSGNRVSMAECTKGPYPGYEWLFMPSFRYFSDDELFTTPPQIANIGNVDLSTMPAITRPEELIEWIQDNNILSLYFGGNLDSPLKLLLRPFATDIGDCEDRPFVAQQINILNYETITSQPACLANEFFPEGCYSF